MRFFLTLLCLLLVQPAALPASQKPARPAAPDTARLERFLRHYFAWPEGVVNVKFGPFKPSDIPGFQEVSIELSAKGQQGTAKETYLVSNDGRYAFRGQPFQLDQDPFRSTREQIDLRHYPSFGALVPQVTIVEYSDLQCGYCKQMTTVLRQDLPRDYPREVRIFFKDFPLKEVHPWATDAAIAGRCLYKQDPEAFWAFHDWSFEQQNQITPQNFREKFLGFAQQKKVDTGKLAACLDGNKEGQEARAEVERSLKEGKALGVTGTPTLFVNGRRLVGNQPLATMKQVIQAEMEYAKGPNCDNCAPTPQPARPN